MARILVGALGEKLRPAFGRHAERAAAALMRDDLGRPEVRYRVAEDAGRVVGVVHLALAQSPESAFFDAVRAELGAARALRASLVLSALAYPGLAPDEAYVEELAVDASARRRGAGRALLTWCADEAARSGRRRLTLWVGAANDPAIHLYRAEGFVPVRRRRSLAGRLLFRMPTAILMERTLPSAGPPLP
jgi:ribosomal protein S18 acetylase RimI-like enzyme